MDSRGRRGKWNPFPGKVEDFLGKVEDEVEDEVEPRLEIVLGSDGVIDDAAGIEAVERRIGEVPVGPVEGLGVIDHAGAESGGGLWAQRRGLRRTMAW